MKILVTGALGFAGRHLTRELAAVGHEVVKHDVQYEPDCYYSDLRDKDSIAKLVQRIKPDACVHLGGIAYVPMGWTDPELVFSVNLMGTLNLLEAFRHAQPSARILVVSSSLIYKEAQGGELLDENAYMYPPDIYAISKIAADLTGLGYAERYGMNVMTARPINHAGPGQSPSFVTSAFAMQLKRIAESGQPGTLRVGNLESRRDLVDVRDVVRAYRLLIEKGTAGEAYNIASGKLCRIGDVLDDLCAIAGVKPDIEVDPDLYRPTDASPSMDIGKITAATGWKPEVPLQQTLHDLYESIQI
ncbi:MAG: GDP-mannose 4,6-dehydratase [Kiritimatiellales bacterium]|nr:GDP-mannose 4,6-dehydratase [Kiritimatiellales bacterium]